MHFCGEGGTLTFISPYFTIYHKLYNNQSFIYGYILYCFAIFRIKLGDYLGDYTKNRYICANILLHGHCA